MSEIQEWERFFSGNISLSLFSLGRIQERGQGFMRVRAGAFDLIVGCHA
jgi:hypothetical protein